MNLNVPWKGLGLAWLACVVLAYFGLVIAKLGILVIPAIAVVLFLITLVFSVIQLWIGSRRVHYSS